MGGPSADPGEKRGPRKDVERLNADADQSTAAMEPQDKLDCAESCLPLTSLALDTRKIMGIIHEFPDSAPV